MLGDKIRTKRLEHGMSIHVLAEQTGLTTGFISQIERNLVDPSITSLRKIATSLNTPVFHFLLDEGEYEPVVRKAERKCFTFEHGQIVYELLSPNIKRSLEMMIVRIKPGKTFYKESLTHLGEEHLLIIEGCMRIQVGDKSYELNKGDSVYYFPSLAHKIFNPNDTTLVFLSAATPPFFNAT